MAELFKIEQLESELDVLYSSLDSISDPEERECIQQQIQQRNLQLFRLMPNE